MTHDNLIQLDFNNVLNDDQDLFIQKQYTFNNNEYNIVKYNKQKLKELRDANDAKFDEVYKYRSVIVRNNKVVSFSPEKSLDSAKFFDIYQNNIRDCWLEDFIDGTMINVFYDNINNTWEIATKSTVGGNILFFNDIKNADDYNPTLANITFRSMFFEACNINNFNLSNLDVNLTYTFVMQHPLNRIVTPISAPAIYLLKIYEINNSRFPLVTINSINIHNYVNAPPYVLADTSVMLVNKYPINHNTYDEFLEFYKNIDIPYYLVGYMIYNSDGKRTKIRNNNYENVRKLRGNHPKLQYNYLCLKKENKIGEFLLYYPEHTVLFRKFKLLLYNYTNELFMNYINCFIRKEQELKNYKFQFKTHMYKLHEKYKTDLKPNNKIIDKKFVIDYMNELHPAQQMFVINYENNATIHEAKHAKKNANKKFKVAVADVDVDVDVEVESAMISC